MKTAHSKWTDFLWKRLQSANQYLTCWETGRNCHMVEDIKIYFHSYFDFCYHEIFFQCSFFTDAPFWPSQSPYDYQQPFLLWLQSLYGVFVPCRRSNCVGWAVRRSSASRCVTGRMMRTTSPSTSARWVRSHANISSMCLETLRLLQFTDMKQPANDERNQSTHTRNYWREQGTQSKHKFIRSDVWFNAPLYVLLFCSL